MKNYTRSILYMRGERPKQSEAHRQYYTDAIEAMKRLNPTEPLRISTSPNMFCPHCKKEYRYRSIGDKKVGERVCNNCGQHMAWDWR